MALTGLTGNYGTNNNGQATGQNPWQQLLQAAQTDPTLHDDLKAVRSTQKGTEAHREAVEKLHQDAAAKGIDLPKKRGAGGKGGKGDDDQMVTVIGPDGTPIQVPASQAAQFASGGSLMSGQGVGGFPDSYGTNPPANPYV